MRQPIEGLPEGWSWHAVDRSIGDRHKARLVVRGPMLRVASNETVGGGSQIGGESRTWSNDFAAELVCADKELDSPSMTQDFVHPAR